MKEKAWEPGVRPAAPEGSGMAQGCAWVDGEYVPTADARLPLFDGGFVHSDVTYDTIGVWKGKFFRLEDHLTRLEESCRSLRLESPLKREEVREILIEVVRRSGLHHALVGAIVTRGREEDHPGSWPRDPRACRPRFFGYAMPYCWLVSPEQEVTGVDVIVAQDAVRISPESIDLRAKNFHGGDLTRATWETIDRGASLPIVTDERGHVTEGPGYNIFALVGAQLLTPARGMLEGITRRTVLEIAREEGVDTQVKDVPATALYRASEIFFTSTAGGVMPVTRLDGRSVGTGRPGPVATRLTERYWELHDDPRYATPVKYA